MISISILFLTFYFFIIFSEFVNCQSQVYCYIGGGNTPTNGSTLAIQNVCASNGYCFLTIYTNGSWNTGCNGPSSFQPNMTGNYSTFCQANIQPTFCACNANFCNTPNNQNFYAMINSTLSNITKPADPGNLTCFECGSPYVFGANGSRSFGPFNITCDGTKYCTGKYCVTRRSQYPRSFCATSWEDPKILACQKVNDPYDDQECVCQQSFCNYPYDPMNPPNTTTAASTTTTTTPPPITTVTTTLLPNTTPSINNSLPPGPWQCAVGCNASQIMFTSDPSNKTTLSSTSYQSPNGCQKFFATCTSLAPNASIAFGNQGSLMAFQLNYTSVTALLYCINNNGMLQWTRFGTTLDPNAMVNVNETHCATVPAVSANTTLAPTTLPPTTPTSNTTLAPLTTSLPPTTTTASINNSLPPGPWQCVSGCNASQITLTNDTTNRTTLLSNGIFQSPAGCSKMLVSCLAPQPTAVVAFATQGRLIAFQPNFTRVDALLYCINNNGSLLWTRFGTTSDPNTMLTVNETHCTVGPLLSSTTANPYATIPSYTYTTAITAPWGGLCPCKCFAAARPVPTTRGSTTFGTTIPTTSTTRLSTAFPTAISTTVTTVAPGGYYNNSFSTANKGYCNCSCQRPYITSPLPTSTAATNLTTITPLIITTTALLSNNPSAVQPALNGTVVVCPNGRQFGPNEMAVQMGELLKETILNSFSNMNGQSAIQNFKDGINTHICNYNSSNIGSGK